MSDTKRATRPPVQVQGKAVVERCGECDNCQEVILEPGLAERGQTCTSMFIMMPDGTIERARTTRIAYRKIRDWYRRKMNVDAVNVGLIEWRDHIRPPEAKP